MKRMIKIPLLLEPQAEGGWTITSPVLPELITEVDQIEDMDACIKDALVAVFELYQDMGKHFPVELEPKCSHGPVRFESLIVAEV